MSPNDDRSTTHHEAAHTDVPTERPPLTADLDILQQRVYRGPNYWAYDPCVRMLVDIGSAEHWPTDQIDGFEDRLRTMLPALEEHTCSVGERGGFFERVHRGTWLGHVAEHIAIELQNRCGHDVSRGKTRGTDVDGQYNVIYQFKDETVGVDAGRLAVRIVNHLIEADADFDVEDEIERLIRTAERAAFGPSTQAILDEATARDIPYMRLDEHSLVQLGQGVHAKRIRATMTSMTSALAVDVASDKELTARMLDAAGLPVPGAEAFNRLRGVIRYAERIGYPVVVKPLDGNHGRGVGINLRNEKDIEDAYDVAKEESRNGYVVCERFIEGNDYRFLVVNGKVAAVAERVPAHVVGDGESTVEALVELVNADERRGIGHEKVLTKIKINKAAEDLLASQDLSRDAVPAKDQIVKLALTGNMSTGGISIDRTYDAHPDNIEIAEQAAKVIGLDIAGIDVISMDITVSMRDNGAGICEVNAAPGFRMHSHPTIGEPQFVAKPVVDMLFPVGSRSRIPITAITGTNGKTTTGRMLSNILKGVGIRVGMTSTSGVVIDEQIVIKADASGPRSARMVLQNPSVEHAVFEVARGGLLREGLGYERNDVAVVTNVASDHLGRGGINTVEELSYVKQVIVEAVPRDGFAVLNADDELVADMRKVCDGEIVFFSMHPDNEHVVRHARRGGRVVTVEKRELGDMIVFKHGRRTMDLVYTHLLPSTFGGRAIMNVYNAMAAAGAAIVSGVHLHDVRHGLRSFNTSYASAPGRLNVVEVDGFHAVVDYCHNPHGMRLLGDFVERVMADRPAEEQGKRICVAAVPGDRRDQDMMEFGEEASKFFDRILIREDEITRGRERGESAARVKDGVEKGMANGARCTSVEIELDELVASRRALDEAKRHDMVVYCSDDVEGAWNVVQKFRVERVGHHSDI